MGELVEFPKRPAAPPPTGYCTHCRGEIRWPIAGAWPEQCVHCGASPLQLTSYMPEPQVVAITSEGWRLDGPFLGPVH
jgi:hypothetical protein